jgi:hypothetical protein
LNGIGQPGSSKMALLQLSMAFLQSSNQLYVQKCSYGLHILAPSNLKIFQLYQVKAETTRGK